MEKIEELASTFVDDELVAIELEDGGRFKVQRAALCYASEYFLKALCGRFQEASSKKLTLPGCTTETFGQILYWIHSGKIAGWKEALNVDPSKATARSNQLRLTKLWLAGDMLLMVDLQNETMRDLRTLIAHRSVSPVAMSLAFESTSPTSPLRRALLHEVASDLLSGAGYYTPEEKDDFGNIAGFMQAFLNIATGADFDEDYCSKLIAFRKDDSAFEVKPAEKDD